MKTSTFYFTGEQELQVHVYKWTPSEDVALKGVVQIAHGMAEVGERYERFATFLTSNGYVVYINDHRGHGKTAGRIENLGYLGEGNGFGHLVKDMHHLTQIIKKDYPELPVFLFSHSMGSFASQNYIMHYGKAIDGVILSGTNGKQGPILKVGLLVAKLLMKLEGPRAQSKLLDQLIFGTYNKQFRPVRTSSDWLSRDAEEVDKYIENPYCGTVFTTSFFYEFFKMLQYIEDINNVEKVPKDLPIYIFAGDKDPVGNNGKGIIKLANTYKSVGIKDVTYRLYKEGRHEMLNEINKEEVMEDILVWLDVK